MPKNKKNKLNVNKNNVEYILRLHLVNVTWRHPGWQCNVTRVTWVTLQCHPGWPWSGEHMIMLNVTWQRLDQSAKQLIVGHTTIHSLSYVTLSHEPSHPVWNKPLGINQTIWYELSHWTCKPALFGGLKALAVNLSRPSGWLWLYAGFVGSNNPRWLKAP